MTTPNNALRRRTLLGYGVLGVPLAFAGLPIYVHVPKFYADTLQVNLAALGAMLLAIRLFDAVTDPVIGMASDRLRRHFRRIMALAAPVLIVSYALLFRPSAEHPLLWLGACLTVVYLSFSTLMINYYALGVSMAGGYHDHTRVAAYRESCMLAGVLLASILPSALLQWYEVREAYGIYSLLLAPLLLLALMACLSASRGCRVQETEEKPGSFFQLLKKHDVRWVLAVGFCNAIPTAITSTLFLFFTSDVLQAGKMSGLLLALYFLSAAFGMPLWTHLSATRGKKNSLLAAMVVAILCFMWAWLLHAGDVWPFAIICVLSGMTVGADSILLPSMLGDVLADKRGQAATVFGLWNLTSKLTMALAAGIALPMLALGGYRPDGENGPEALAQLSLCYALLPCLFKAVAVALLYCSPLDREKTA